MPEFLLEIRSEEIPARMQARAAADLERLVSEELTKARLSHGAIRRFDGPRRIGVAVADVPARQEDLREERKGPRVGAPDKAIDGFLTANGLTSLDQCETRDDKKGAFYVAVIERQGQRTADVLPPLIARVQAGFPWPKSMRWGSGPFRWVRPLQGILAVLDGQPLAEIASDTSVLEEAVVSDSRYAYANLTVGHRFLAPDDITVTDSADYVEKLRRAYVLADRAEREARIRDELHRLAAQEGYSPGGDAEALIAENAGLTEWPVLLVGSIDERFMGVPKEALATSMAENQKYFALYQADGSLAPRFILVANIVPRDGGQQIIQGNERVLRARLADAKFFWDTDRRTRLADLVPRLGEVTFHARLGTMADKAGRLSTLARQLAPVIPGCDPAAAGRAAWLAKADLLTGMVDEFPELQGTMGRYYAAEQGEGQDVAEAIGDHYRPQGPGDRVPGAAVSIAVALADKIDTLAGFFAIDEKPTGSKDPFALRRAALGIIRLILENGVRLPLARVFGEAPLPGDVESAVDRAALTSALLSFFADRLKVALREQGVRHDLIDAVFATTRDEGGAEDDLVRLLARVRALEDFLASDDGANLLIAYRRAANIVRIESKKDGAAYAEAPDPDRLVEPAERDLVARLDAAERDIDTALTQERFADAMAALAGLRAPVDRFFDAVMVNVDEVALRANRLRLLSRIQATMRRIADFSRIEG